jgi:tetratricopeptide (TPR) repeat protein
MSTAVMTNRMELTSFADRSLKAAARFWFVVAVLGQLIFAFTVACFYGLTALRGNLQAWNAKLANGYVAGQTMGNTALIGHIIFATVISVAGAFQLIPRVRNRFPVFHRWNGRLYLLAAFTQAITGLYLTLSGRKLVGDLSQQIAVRLSAVLILLCGAMALRFALVRDFQTHRRWALRLFIVSSGSWFFRVALFLSFLIFGGPFGFDPDTFTGPFLTFLAFATFLGPLGILELYLRAQDRPSALRRMLTAFVLVVLTLGMAGGVFGATMGMWLPTLKRAYDSRKSVGETLSATIASRGIEAASLQYRELKSSSASTFNFDEEQLNTLGYELLRAHKLPEAIRIFQLNVEAYPQSGNVYDSLGEAYSNNGDKAQAIANYEKSLRLNPKNHNAVKMLQKLNAP